MPSTYRLDVYNTSGVLQYMLTDFSALAYTKRINAPGMVQISLPGDHVLIGNMADKWQLEVWRLPPGGSWGREITGLYRYGSWTYGDQGSRFAAVCPGIMTMLAWRIVAWYAGTTNRSKFISAKSETIMKRLADYNAAANATTGNGRIRTGTITGLSIESDGANGNTLDWFCSFENLLATLQKLARVAGGDFDLVKTSATTYQFRWYTGQLGTDRTATVIFSIERGNMSQPKYEENRAKEKTVALVGGQGEEADREVVVRTGSNYHVTNNNVEAFFNATDINTTAGLNARGDEKLDEAEAREDFSFKTLEAPQTIYGVDYFLGDKVTAINPFDGTSLTLKVNAVNVTLDEGGQESVTPEFITA